MTWPISWILITQTVEETIIIRLPDSVTYFPNMYANVSSDVSIYPWLFSYPYPIAKDDTRCVCLVLFHWGIGFLFSINSLSSDVSLIQITLYHMKRLSDCNINVIFSTLWAEKLIHFAKRSFLKQNDWRICCWPNDNWACIHCVMHYKHIAKHSKIGTAYELILV